MLDVELIAYLWSLLTQVFPHGWAIAAVVCFVAASAVINLFATPVKPGPDARWTAWTWWLLYRLCEVAALVGRRAKQRPDLANKAFVLASGLRHGRVTPGDLLDLADDLKR